MYAKLHSCRFLLSKVKGVGTLMTSIVFRKFESKTEQMNEQTQSK
jgi:hypothetical protein